MAERAPLRNTLAVVTGSLVLATLIALVLIGWSLREVEQINARQPRLLEQISNLEREAQQFRDRASQSEIEFRLTLEHARKSVDLLQQDARSIAIRYPNSMVRLKELLAVRPHEEDLAGWHSALEAARKETEGSFDWNYKVNLLLLSLVEMDRTLAVMAGSVFSTSDQLQLARDRFGRTADAVRSAYQPLYRSPPEGLLERCLEEVKIACDKQLAPQGGLEQLGLAAAKIRARDGVLARGRAEPDGLARWTRLASISFSVSLILLLGGVFGSWWLTNHLWAEHHFLDPKLEARTIAVVDQFSSHWQGVERLSQRIGKGTQILVQQVHGAILESQPFLAFIGRTREGLMQSEATLLRAKSAAETSRAALKELEQSASSIRRITDQMRDIAFRTKILALNSAIEAAHAGEAGLGFAIVADEVKNLAGSSEDSAGEIDATAVKLFENVTSVMASLEQLSTVLSDQQQEQKSLASTLEGEQSKGGGLKSSLSRLEKICTGTPSRAGLATLAQELAALASKSTSRQ